MQMMTHDDTSRWRRRTKILVVADEPALALSIVAGLERRGHRAVWALALGAVAWAIAERPRLILLDMDLPNDEAREILGYLKGDPRTATIPVLAIG